MKFKIIISPRAQFEIETATDYYFDISRIVLIDFNERLTETYNYLKINPYFQKRYKNFRAVPIKKFPYILFFTIDEDKSS